MKKQSVLRPSRNAAILLILAMASGCVPGTPFVGKISASRSPVLQLSWAKAKRTSQGILVSGQIQQVHCCHYVRGYIHVEAKGSNGATLASTNVEWGDFNPRQLHSAWFKAVLPYPSASSATAINLEFVSELPNRR